MTAADLGGFKTDMRRMRREGNRASKDVERDFDRMGRSVAGIAKTAGLAIGAAFVTVGGLAVKQAAEFETLRISMNALNGSVEEGARNFERLKEFSAGTPFQLRDLAKAQNMLQGFGMAADDAFESVKMIGDIAAITGADINGIGIAFGQAAAEGRLMTRDIRQLINQGVPAIKLLAETMGVAQSEVLGLAEEGKISFDILQRSFRDATSTGGMFADGMKQQADTISGSFSTFKDNASILLGAIGDLITETTGLKDSMKVGSEVMKGMTDRVESLEISTGNLKDEWRGLKVIFTETFSALDFLVGGFDDLVDMFIRVEQHMPTGLFRKAIGGIRDFLGWVGRTTEGVQDLSEETEALNSGTEWTMVSHIEDAEIATTNTAQATKDWSTELENIKSQLNSMPSPEIYDPTFDGSAIEPMQRLNDIVREMGNQDFSHRLSTEIEEIKEKSIEASGAARFFSTTLADGLDQVLFRARSVEDAIKGIVRQLASRAFTTGLMGLFTGGFGAGGFFGSMFGGFRASGGSVSSGKSYIVGENGPEMFTPRTSGSIIPNSKMGGSRTVNLNLRVSGEFQDNGNTLKAVIEEQTRQIERLI